MKRYINLFLPSWLKRPILRYINGIEGVKHDITFKLASIEEVSLQAFEKRKLHTT